MTIKFRKVIVPIQADILDEIVQIDKDFVVAKKTIDDEIYYELPEITGNNIIISENKQEYANGHMTLSREKKDIDKEYVYVTGDLEYNPKERVVYKNRVDLKLDKNELVLFSEFMQNPKTVLSRENLMKALELANLTKIRDNTLTQEMKRLRDALEPNNPTKYIETRWGIGYKWILIVKKRKK